MENISTSTVAPQNNKLRPNYFFLNIGMVICLFTVVIAYINLVFETLDRAFPDTLNALYQYGYNSYTYDGIRTSLAIVLIFFPIYILVSMYWKKEKELSKSDFILRKWIIYFILFFVFLTATIDLVTLVKYFISGEITIRFILKVLVILIVVALLYIYYHAELKRNILESNNKKKYLLIFATILVLLGIAYTFNVIGSPASQRALRFDQKKLEDLQSIQSQIISYWQQKQKLPETINDLVDPLQSWQVIPKDPDFQKGINYEYIKKGEQSFELCAVFKKPIPEEWQESNIYLPMYKTDVGGSVPISGGLQNESWKHDVGRTCFSRTVDKERYPFIIPHQN